VLASDRPYSPRIHWLLTALVCITVAMVLLSAAGLLGPLPLSVVVLAGVGVTVSFGTGGVFAIVPLLFPDRPGTASGFVGGISTTGGIVYPIAFGLVPNVHAGYAVVAGVVFVPIIAFFLWAMQSDGSLATHGIGTRDQWLADGEDGGVSGAGGDD
jgi:NNP family nitrate/nitrite transporter-like MFS transporter